VLSRRAFLGVAGGAVVLGGVGIAAERPSVRQWFADLRDPDPAAPAPSCGTGDPFYPAVRTFAPAVPLLAGTDFAAGGHTDAFWRRSAPAQLGFLGAALR
jgi:hypothetical protein